MGSTTTVRRALRLIEDGALNRDGVAQLAERLGVGERYLRKLFQRELGVSPGALALNQRLLFAKKLLAETSMPMTQVAYAAGFGSVRRFNDAVQAHFRLAPGALRRHSRTASASSPIRLHLQYRPPYDWAGVSAFFARHAIAGIETVSDDEYTRVVALEGALGHIRVCHLPHTNNLQLQIDIDELRLLMPIVARVRRMFDLDANPSAIAAVLGRDPELSQLLQRFPGIRAPGHWSLWESAARAVVGQQVSTAAARSVLHKIAGVCGGPGFPEPGALTALADCHYPMPGRRRDTLRHLGELFDGRNDQVALDEIAALKGIGPWSIGMIGIRGVGQPDCFPNADLGLLRAYEALAPGENLQARSEIWAPWRSYAANLLWRSLK
ncbi:MAG: DNA-3-methyladenine glycosylase 2 [Halioglobus sp.]